MRGRKRGLGHLVLSLAATAPPVTLASVNGLLRLEPYFLLGLYSNGNQISPPLLGLIKARGRRQRTPHHGR